MKIHRTLAPALVGLLLVGAACGGSDDDTSTTEPAVGSPSAICAPGDTECVDADLDPAGDSGNAGEVDPELAWTDDDIEAARDSARAVLGMNEATLPADVRVARRGEEDMMLTMDYVLGRRTVELDDDGSGYRVVAVTVELPDGSEQFDLTPG